MGNHSLGTPSFEIGCKVTAMWKIENNLPIHLAVLRIERVVVTEGKKHF